MDKIAYTNESVGGNAHIFVYAGAGVGAGIPTAMTVAVIAGRSTTVIRVATTNMSTDMGVSGVSGNTTNPSTANVMGSTANVGENLEKPNVCVWQQL